MTTQTLLSPFQPPLLSLRFPGAGIPRAFGIGVISAALNVPVEDAVGNPAGDTWLPEPYSSLEDLPLSADQEVLVDMPLRGLVCLWSCVMEIE